MQMGDYRLDHLVGLTCMEKSGNYWNRENRCALQKNAWFWLQILACDPEENPVNPANRYNLHHIGGL
jgi:hypothetical protein